MRESTMSRTTIALFVSACAVAVVAAPGCSSKRADSTGAGGGTIAIDGSSTVFPLTEAVAEEFRKTSAARVTIGVSGTGGGFKKFCAGEIAITGASRTIKSSEKSLCDKAGVGYVELAVAFDGISVVVHPGNRFVDTLTTDELRRIWEPGAQGKITRWSQVRDGFPDEPLHLFGPGVDSGTFDYFTKKIVGKAQASRGDYTASEDDNVLVHGVSSHAGGLGFFGFAYYAENKDKLKVVPIQHGSGPAVKPTQQTIADGSYSPLSRPIFIYAATAAAKDAGVQAFIDFYLKSAGPLAREVGYVSLTAERLAAATAAWTGRP